MGLLRDTDSGLKLHVFDFSAYRLLRIRTKLLLALIPLTILVLIATGFTTNWFSSQFLNEAIQRNVRLQTLALAHEVEIFLNQCREDLLELRHAALTRSTPADFWTAQKLIKGWGYAGIAYLSQKMEDSVYLVSTGEEVTPIAPANIPLVRPDPRGLMEKVRSEEDDFVWLSPIVEGIYPLSGGTQKQQNIANKVVRLATLSKNQDGSPKGVIALAVSVYQLRDILSRFNSSQSPIFAFIRSPELRYSFLFDTDGWTWFQSEETVGREKELSTDTARSGFSGTFGKPGLPSAFRPFPEHVDYWKMVRDIQQGKSGLITLHDSKPDYPSMTDEYYVGYAPVRFIPGPGKDPIVFAGVALVDRSRLGMWAGYRQVDVIFVIALCTTVFVSLLVYLLGRVITRPILDLAAGVTRIQETGELSPIQLPDHDYETSFLRYTINNMLATIRNQMGEIRVKDEQLLAAARRERAKLEDEIRSLKQHVCFQDIGEIIGLCPVMETLRMDILKAASVDADVLILGETGTGKQLAAEAIHRHSSRSSKPFVSINCGALDESLLLDELFGHIKGAFTEARTDRKGAFLLAQGGVLFLDEIGTASAKVQQALLRAISVRKVSPLGSDQEYDVDVRVITATNEDLQGLIEKGRFREDLYYRLNVITVRTPALRDHKEDIPVLAESFLKAAGRQMNKEYIGMSRGALEKLKAHRWPGNVRELKNSITRAVAMAEGTLIHSRDILLEREDISPAKIVDGHAAQSLSSRTEQEIELAPPLGLQLNDRQRKAFSVLLRQGEISRSEYQRVVGNGLPTRTAVYDLQDLAKRGIVTMVGRGPATRYRLVMPQEPTSLKGRHRG